MTYCWESAAYILYDSTCRLNILVFAVKGYAQCNKNSPAVGGVSILVKGIGLALHFVQLRLNAIKISAA